MPTVAVLMSTYNGEKYIREQLDSIFAQKDVDVRLYVRDDGSKDTTVNILKEYKKLYPIEIIQDGENVGPGDSFMRLVYRYANEPDIEYYAFADQDDIWLDDKMIIAIKRIEQEESTEPTLYSSNQTIYRNGKECGLRHNEPQNTSLVFHLSVNTIAGCTFVFNKALAMAFANAKEPSETIKKMRIHDSWLMLVAISIGKVIYDTKSHMLYRIHEANAVGIKKISLREKWERFRKLIFPTVESNLRMQTAQQLLNTYDCKEEAQRVLLLFANYQKDWRAKKNLMCDKQIKAECTDGPLLFSVKVLFNRV